MFRGVCVCEYVPIEDRAFVYFTTKVPRSPSGKSYENYDPKYNIYEVSRCCGNSKFFATHSDDGR